MVAGLTWQALVACRGAGVPAPHRRTTLVVECMDASTA